MILHCLPCNPGPVSKVLLSPESLIRKDLQCSAHVSDVGINLIEHCTLLLGKVSIEVNLRDVDLSIRKSALHRPQGLLN